MLRGPQDALARSGEERKDPMKKRQVRATAAIAATAVAAIATIALAAMAITMNGNTRAMAQPTDEQPAPSNETLTVSPADRTLFDRDLERSQNRRRNHCRSRQHERQRNSSGGRNHDGTGQPCADK